jgi:hypothetical protein
MTLPRHDLGVLNEQYLDILRNNKTKE